MEAPKPPPMPRRNLGGGVSGYGGYGAGSGHGGWGEKGACEPRQKTEIEIVPDFGMKIRAARERMHIGRKVLAEMINEKESVLERLEHEKMLPSEVVALKLEKALGIRLLEEVGVGPGGASARKEKGKGLTLGDVVFVKKRGENGE